MERIKKPAEDKSAGSIGTGTKKGRISEAYCNTDNMPLSSLLDQALNLIDYHEAHATHFEHLAQFHRDHLARHRAIKQSLEQLIPPARTWPGGGGA